LKLIMFSMGSRFRGNAVFLLALAAVAAVSSLPRATSSAFGLT
jgi:hypothetical protein